MEEVCSICGGKGATAPNGVQYCACPFDPPLTTDDFDSLADAVEFANEACDKLEALRTRLRALLPALEILEFHEGSAEVERPGAQPTVRINAEDFATALAAVRRAALNEEGTRNG